MEQINNILNSYDKMDQVDQETCMPRQRRKNRLKNANQGCNSIDTWNLRLELRRKVRQGLGRIFWLWVKVLVKVLDADSVRIFVDRLS